MHVIIYPRKSREDIQKEERTGEDVLATHRDRLIKMCQQQGHTYNIKQEVVSGDTISGRPVFQEILYTDFPSGEYQGIGVNDISRLGRGNMKDAGEIYQALIDHNIKVVTPHKTYSPKNRSDLRQIRFELFLSREEYEMIRDRLADGRDAAARSGRAATNIYTLGLRSVRGTWEVDQKGLDVARQVFEWVRDGKQYTWIMNYLNSIGQKTCRNKEWTPTAVKQLIKNVHYEGYQRWKGDILKAQHGPLLPLDLIYEAREKLLHWDTHSTIRNHQFWAVIHCGKCGKRMYGLNRRDKYTGKREYIYELYFCVGKHNPVPPKCYSTIRAEWIHKRIVEALWTIVNDKEVQKRLTERRTPGDLGAVKNEIDKCNEEIKAKQARLKQIKEDYISGKLTDVETYNDARETLSGQIKFLQSQVRELEPKTKQKALTLKELILSLKNTLTRWEDLPNIEKYQTVREYTERIDFHKEGRGKTLKIILRLPL